MMSGMFFSGKTFDHREPKRKKLPVGAKLSNLEFLEQNTPWNQERSRKKGAFSTSNAMKYLETNSKRRFAFGVHTAKGADYPSQMLSKQAYSLMNGS